MINDGPAMLECRTSLSNCSAVICTNCECAYTTEGQTTHLDRGRRAILNTVRLVRTSPSVWLVRTAVLCRLAWSATRTEPVPRSPLLPTWLRSNVRNYRPALALGRRWSSRLRRAYSHLDVSAGAKFCARAGFAKCAHCDSSWWPRVVSRGVCLAHAWAQASATAACFLERECALLERRGQCAFRRRTRRLIRVDPDF